MCRRQLAHLVAADVALEGTSPRLRASVRGHSGMAGVEGWAGVRGTVSVICFLSSPHRRVIVALCRLWDTYLAYRTTNSNEASLQQLHIYVCLAILEVCAPPSLSCAA